MSIGFVYMTTNLVNGMRYIGQHTRGRKNYLGSGTLITRAIQKYGKENFSREILEYSDSNESLDELERFYIKKYNSVDSPKFYNIAEGGKVINYWKGKKRSEASNKKTSESMKSLNLSGERNPMFGKNFKGSRNVLMLDQNLSVMKEFSSAAEVWRYLREEYNDLRTPDVKAQLYMREKNLYLGKYLFVRKHEILHLVSPTQDDN